MKLYRPLRCNKWVDVEGLNMMMGYQELKLILHHLTQLHQKPLVSSLEKLLHADPLQYEVLSGTSVSIAQQLTLVHRGLGYKENEDKHHILEYDKLQIFFLCPLNLLRIHQPQNRNEIQEL